MTFTTAHMSISLLDIAPVLLGSGERIFDPDVTPALELLETEHSPVASHVRYRVVR